MIGSEVGGVSRSKVEIQRGQGSIGGGTRCVSSVVNSQATSETKDSDAQDPNL